MFTTPIVQEGAQVRCAIYTRKSVEYGLEIEFNSLESQRAICSSYIASQRHRGWHELPQHYDDGGKSGGDLARPALQELLADVEKGVVDVVVVYKLDRLTRTLLDFVRLSDLFQQFGVTFISVTQNFDSSESTGRLILNVLLTFAQFEREMASDRLRDKFGAMKQRGMFVGGHPPFGYTLKNKKLTPDPDHIENVKFIFRRYLETESYNAVQRECVDLGIKRRDRISKRGNLIVGKGIHASSVWHMLGNPVYIGDVRYKEHQFEGQHEAIIDRETWDAVQKLRAKRTRAKVVLIHRTDLLRGLMHDSFGRMMGVLRDYRKGTLRYYVSNQNEWGKRHGVRRMRTNADQLETLVMATLRDFFEDRERIRSLMIEMGIVDKSLSKLTKATLPASKRIATLAPRQLRAIYQALFEHIELSESRLKVVLRGPEVRRFLLWDGVGFFRGARDDWDRPHQTALIDVPVSAVRLKRSLWLPFKERQSGEKKRQSQHLIRTLKWAREARDLVEKNRETPLMDLAKRMNCKKTRFARFVRLNYLAPDIIMSIIDGTQPRDLTARRLMQMDIPMDWSLQRKMFGYADKPDYLKACIGY